VQIDATAILGDHVAQFHEATAPSDRWNRWTARRSSAPRGSRPAIGSPICPRPPCADCAMATAVGWLVPQGSDGTDHMSAGPAGGRLLGGAFDLVTALERFLAKIAPTQGGACHRRPRAVVLGDAANVVVMGSAVEPGGLRRSPRRGRARAGCGGAARDPARRPVFVGALEGAGDSSAPRCSARVSGPREIAASVSSAMPTSHDGRRTRRRGPLGTSAATTTSIQEHLRRGPARGRGRRIETGRQNLGTLFGDHAKTAIRTMPRPAPSWARARTCSDRPRRPSTYRRSRGVARGRTAHAGRFPARRRARDDPPQHGRDPERRRSLSGPPPRDGRMMRLLVLGSGSRELLRGETEGGPARREFSAREIERAPSRRGSTSPGRGDRPDARARDHASAHRAAQRLRVPVLTAPGTWDRPPRGCGATPRPRPRARSRWGRSASGCPTSHVPPSPWPSPYGRQWHGPASPTIGAPPPPCATCCASSRRSCSGEP
jgi:hypothetical protein